MRYRIPLLAKQEERVVYSSGKSYVKNMYLEPSQEGLGYQLVKRPGLNYINGPTNDRIAYGLFYNGTVVTPETLMWKFDGTSWDLYRIYGGAAVQTKLYDIPNTSTASTVYNITWRRLGDDGSGFDQIAMGTQSNLNYVYKPGSGITEITDSDCNGFARGIAYLDGFTFAAGNGAGITNSDLDDPFTWDATNIIFPSSMREYTGVQWIANHRNTVVAFGKTSIEFFENVGNPAGSPLAPRRDIVYNNIGLMGRTTGLVDKNPFVPLVDIDYGERIVFLSHNVEGKVAVHLLQNFELTKLSDITIDKYLNQRWDDAVVRYPMLSSCALNNKTLIFLTVRNYLSSSLTEKYTTFVCDLDTPGSWMEWTTDSNIVTGGAFEAVSGAAISPGAGLTRQWPMASAVQMSDGKVYTLIEEQYRDKDSSSTNRNITCEIQTPRWYGNERSSGLWKYMSQLYVIGDKQSSAGNISVSFSDDDYNTFSTAETLDLSNYESSLNGLGAFKNRAFRLTYTDNTALRLQHMEAEVRTGYQ